MKQILVVRKDLNMRKGKIAAQCAHASMAVLLNAGSYLYGNGTVPHTFELSLTPELREWLTGLFTKVCVSVDSEQELLEVYNKALSAGLLCAMITDSGATEFHGVPTRTCCAIGPATHEALFPITGHLKLL